MASEINLKIVQNDAWQSWLAGLYPHLAWDRLVAALPHPQTGLYPPSRHPFHSGADEVHGRTTVVADDLIERAQSCTNLSLCVVKVGNSQRGQSMIENSVLVWALSVHIRKYSRSPLWSYLLRVRLRLLVPWRGRVAPSKTRGTKVLYLAQVSQYGAGGAIHPIKGITGVWLPKGPQKLPERQILNQNNDESKIMAHIFGYVQQFIMQIKL